MLKKSKSTKQIRAIDRIIKFQIDDGIESLTISGKEVLADVSIDSKANVTLYLNADKDKLNEIKSLVPFITVETKEGGKDPEKTKSVELSQDLTQFALEIADNSTELANLVKSKSSIVLDLSGLVQQLLEIAGKIAELEAKNLEQDNRLTVIEAKDLEQDNRLTTIEAKDLEQDERLSFLENSGNGGNDYRTELITTIKPYYEDHDFMLNRSAGVGIDNLVGGFGYSEPIRDGIVFITIHRYINKTTDGTAVLTKDGTAIITAMVYNNKVSSETLRQKHIIEMKTVSEGIIKLHCEVLNDGTEKVFKIYSISSDSIDNYVSAYSTDKYKISVHGFNFVPQQVLVPYVQMGD